MRRLAIVALLVAAVAALAAAANGCGGDSSSSSTRSTTSRSDPDGGGEPSGLEAAVERAAASGVPVRIPPALLESPPAGAEHAEVLRSPTDTYALGLATKSECRFKSTCVVAIFSGAPGNSRPTGRKLKLARGIEGVYEPGRCGPGCEFGTVAWEQAGDTYGVGVPEASVDELVVLANEAIRASPVE
jgi:hypothetical protein